METTRFQIKVKVIAEPLHKESVIDLSRMDLSPSEWEKMSEEDQTEAVQNFVDENWDQPYYVVEKISSPKE